MAKLEGHVDSKKSETASLEDRLLSWANETVTRRDSPKNGYASRRDVSTVSAQIGLETDLGLRRSDLARFPLAVASLVRHQAGRSRLEAVWCSCEPGVRFSRPHFACSSCAGARTRRLAAERPLRHYRCQV